MTVVQKSCALIGDTHFLLPFQPDHRDPGSALHTIALQEIEKVVLTGHHRFLCGFTAGVDLLLAEAVLELRRKYPYIVLESVMAYENEAAKWPEHIREQYYELLKYCDAERLLQTQFSMDCLVRRNRYLVDHADILLTVTEGLLSNPLQAIHYAALQGKSVLCISPSTLATKKIS